ncbi:hemin-degrading factor [Pontibacter silvestris]|uniref:Hemin-degrading factor n=1 Tax=Pontibacter silvestris TaxID=2305183 RepID=A0ABW4X3J5_9BACT|nr:ChuX/HutX family heme-like substrate-binding protein [Pontibacter silvestris]MCC9134870.1 hemin-degrading factor [Pontibacter silvestris]
MEDITIDASVRNSSAAVLSKAWKGIQNAKPYLRIREAAKELNTSEAALLATTIGENCIRLAPNWHDLVKRLPELGHVMALTRNESCILEHKGVFADINVPCSGNGGVGTVIGPIEARMFFFKWHVAFAVEQEKSGRQLTSLQVFDKAGDAVLKVYLQEGKSDYDAYYRLVQDFRSEDQSPEQYTQPYAAKVYAREIDTKDFLGDWSELQDTHDFHGMLAKHNIHRHDALELARNIFTFPVAASSTLQILESAAEVKLPVMIFVGNRGNIQIHQDKVKTVRVLERGHNGPETWVNVLDPSFNMHLRQDTVATAWIVRKPTRDDIVTSVEVFDENKELVLSFFGLRKPGQPEMEEWRKIVSELTLLVNLQNV